MVRNTRNVAKIKKRCDPYLKKMSNKNCNDFLGAKNNDSTSEKWVIVKFYTSKYQKCGDSNPKNDSRPCLGASAILKSVDFTAFVVNVKTIAPKKYLYQSGHAIWWSDFPMIMYTLFDNYDMSGKTVIPFSTHGGSGLSGTISILKQQEPNANIIENALSISRSNMDGCESTVTNWLKEIGY